MTAGLIVALAGVPPVVATLVLLIGGRGLAQTLASGQVLSITSPGYATLGTGSVIGLPVPLIVVFVVLLARRFTVVGLYLHAVGSNPAAARLAGLRVSAVQCAAYTACGVLGALAGLIASADIRAADPNHLGVGVELDAILAAVIGGNSLSGGRPRLVGAIFGALIMQTATVALQMWSVHEGPTLVLKAVVAIAACAAVSWHPEQSGSRGRVRSRSLA